MDESEVDDILKSIDERDLEEEDCFFVFTLVLVERSKVRAQQKNKKRTWQQSKDLFSFFLKMLLNSGLNDHGKRPVIL